MADVKYNGVDRGNDTRYRINNNIIRMMNANPALGTGYLIGNMIGENYFGKKRANRRSEVKDAWDKLQGSNGGEVKYSGTSKEPNYYDSMNKAFDEYTKNNPGNAYIDTAKGVYPRTPQQANKSTETPTVADAWRKMENGSTYNPGSTPVGNPTGARDLSNVMPQTNGKVLFEGRLPEQPVANTVQAAWATPNGKVLYEGVNTAAPVAKTPIEMSYTPEQLAQIAAQNYTADELRKMGAGQLVAPQTAPVVQNASVPVSPSAKLPAYAPNPMSESDDHAPWFANPLSESDDHDPVAGGLLSNAGQAYLDDYRKRGSINLQKLFDDVLQRKIFG